MEVHFNVDDIRRLGNVKANMKWKDLSEVQYIFNLVKGMNKQEEVIGNKCANQLRNIALKRKVSVKELLKNCPSLRQKPKKKTKEQKYTKNYFRGRGGRDDGKHQNTQPAKTNTERIIEAISAQNRASAQAAAQFQIGQTQRLLTLPNQAPPPLMIKDVPTPPAIGHAPSKMPQEQYTPDLRKELGLENWGHDFEAGTAERKAELKALDGKRNARVESYVRGIGEEYDMRMYNRTFPPPIAYDDDGNEINWAKYKVPPNLDLSRIRSGQTGTTEGSELKEEPYQYEPPTITEEETIGGSGKLKHARVKGYYVGDGSVATDNPQESQEGLMTRSEIISEYGESQAREMGLISSRSSSSQPTNPFLQSGSESDLASLTSSQRELYLSKQQKIKEQEARLAKLEPMLEKMKVMKDIQEKEFKQNMAQTEMLRGAVTQQYIGTLDAGGLTDNEKKANIRSLKDERFKRDVLDHYGFESQTESSSASGSSSSSDPFGVVKDLKDATPSEAADYLLQREEVFAPKTKEEMLESLSGQSFQYKANQTKKNINDAIGEEKARLEQIQKMKALSAPSRNQSTRESLSSAGSFKPASGVRQEAIRNLAEQQEGEVHNQLHPSGVSQQSYFQNLEGIRAKMRARAEQSKAKNEFRDEELSRLKQEMGTFGSTLKPTEEYLKTHSAAEVFQQKKIDDAEKALVAKRKELAKEIKGGEGEKAFYDFALNQPPKLGDTIAEEGKPSLHFLQTHSMYQYLEQQKKDKAAIAAQDESVLPEGAQFNPDGTINYIPSAYSYGGLGYDEDN